MVPRTLSISSYGARTASFRPDLMFSGSRISSSGSLNQARKLPEALGSLKSSLDAFKMPLEAFQAALEAFQAASVPWQQPLVPWQQPLCLGSSFLCLDNSHKPLLDLQKQGVRRQAAGPLRPTHTHTHRHTHTHTPKIAIPPCGRTTTAAAWSYGSPTILGDLGLWSPKGAPKGVP